MRIKQAIAPPPQKKNPQRGKKNAAAVEPRKIQKKSTNRGAHPKVQNLISLVYNSRKKEHASTVGIQFGSKYWCRQSQIRNHTKAPFLMKRFVSVIVEERLSLVKQTNFVFVYPTILPQNLGPSSLSQISVNS